MGSSARPSYAVKTHDERKQNVIAAAVHRNRTPFVSQLGTTRRGSRGKSQKTVCSTARDPTVLKRRRRRFHTRGAKQQRPAHSEDGWFVCGRRRPSSQRTAPFLRFGAHKRANRTPFVFETRKPERAHVRQRYNSGCPRVSGNAAVIALVTKIQLTTR